MAVVMPNIMARISLSETKTAMSEPTMRRIRQGSTDTCCLSYVAERN
jgi:hypothetical protein